MKSLSLLSKDPKHEMKLNYSISIATLAEFI